MIVRQFLQWVRNAPPGERADATSALARAYLHSDLSPDDRAAAEGAMIMLLDDPSPLVRRALAEVFASSQKAPPVIVDALAADQPQIAVPILSRSPLLLEADLIDLIATGHPEAQTAIAGRAMLPRVARRGHRRSRVGGSLSRAAGKFRRRHRAFLHRPHGRALRPSCRRSARTLLARDDLPMPTRQALLSKLSQTLAGFVTARHWLGSEHAEQAAREACERATVALAAETPYDEIAALVAHLRQSGQLTAGMILRGLLSGNVVLFEEALTELSGMPLDRVTSYIHDKNLSGFLALYRKAGLPDAAYPAFREAIAAMREGVLMGGQGNAARLRRAMVERVLSRLPGRAGCR